VFGDVAFAQAPFAALGGATFSKAVSETASAEAQSSFVFKAGSLMQEFVSGIEAQTAVGTMVATASEAASGLDAVSSDNNVFNATQLAYASGVDAVTAQGDFFCYRLRNCFCNRRNIGTRNV